MRCLTMFFLIPRPSSDFKHTAHALTVATPASASDLTRGLELASPCSLLSQHRSFHAFQAYLMSDLMQRVCGSYAEETTRTEPPDPQLLPHMSNLMQHKRRSCGSKAEANFEFLPQITPRHYYESIPMRKKRRFFLHLYYKKTHLSVF